jgi:putative ABC transport system permease protein
MFEDLSFFLRRVRRQKWAFGLVLGVLAVAVGSTAAVVSLADAVVLRPLPVRDLDRVVRLGGVPVVTHFVDEVEWWRQATSLDAVAIHRSGEVPVEGPGGIRETVRTAIVSADFFSVFQLDLQAGRAFGRQDEVEGQHQVVVLSHAFWNSYFGGQESALGEELRINQVPYTVVGVAPRGFEFPPATQLWVPRLYRGRFPLAPEMKGHPAGWAGGWVARLHPGASLQQARDELYVLLQSLIDLYTQRTHITWGRDLVVDVAPLRRILSARFLPAITIFLVGSCLVLLLAAVNCATFLLGQASVRRGEIAVRQVLGASPARLFRQALTETAALAVVSGLLGYLVADWTLAAVPRLFPEYAPFLRIAALTPLFVFGVALMIALVVGLSVGLVPTLQSRSADLLSALKNAGGVVQGPRGKLLRRFFLGAEVSLALVLCVGAVWSLGAFLDLARAEPGFDTRNVFTAQLSFPREPLGRDQFLALDRQVQEAAQAVAGVQEAALASAPPVAGTPGGYFVHFEEGQRFCPTTVVTSGYFRVLGIPILAGRTFAETDRDVAIVSERAARDLWGESSPIGQPLWFDGERVPREVVGVARDTRGITTEPAEAAHVYLPYSHPYRGSVSVSEAHLIARCRESCSAAMPAFLGRLEAREGERVISRAALLADQVEAAVAPVRVPTVLFSAYGVLALGLAVLGVYALTSYLASLRQHEIGVRMVLGADASDVVFLVMREGMITALFGLILGGLGVLASVRLMSPLLGIAPPSPMALVLVGSGVFLAALFASLAPSLSAARRNPADLLKVT